MSGIINNKAYISYDLLEKDNMTILKINAISYIYTLDKELIKILKI